MSTDNARAAKDRTHAPAKHKFYRSTANGSVHTPFRNATGYMDAHPDEWEPITEEEARAEFALQAAKRRAVDARKRRNADTLLDVASGVVTDELPKSATESALVRGTPAAAAPETFPDIPVEVLGSPIPAFVGSPIPPAPGAEG